MVDIKDIQEGLEYTRYLKISYRYKSFKYLVADKFGNLFTLPHCPGKRTIGFKQLRVYKNGNKKAINYKNSNISFAELTRKSYRVNELFLIPLK